MCAIAELDNGQDSHCYVSVMEQTAFQTETGLATEGKNGDIIFRCDLI